MFLNSRNKYNISVYVQYNSLNTKTCWRSKLYRKIEFFGAKICFYFHCRIIITIDTENFSETLWSIFSYSWYVEEVYFYIFSFLFFLLSGKCLISTHRKGHFSIFLVVFLVNANYQTIFKLHSESKMFLDIWNLDRKRISYCNTYYVHNSLYILFYFISGLSIDIL